VVIRGSNGQGRLVFAYDGQEAWQSNSIGSDSAESGLMPPDEAKNFIRDATIGGHLLDPLLEGKQIEITGVVEVGDKTCYEIEITLPDGQRILSAIDIVEYAERRQITTNQVNNQKEINFYRDFRVIDGVRFPFTNVMKSNGKEMHRVEMIKIRVNPGLTEAIFQRPSAVIAPREEAENTEKDFFNGNQQTTPTLNSFGEAPFGGSSFPEPDEFEKEPVIDKALTP
jgi:hypothetical protein